MDNRFGLKDFVVIVLILTTIILVTLSAFMKNRDWDRLDQIMGVMEQQQQAISGYEQTVRQLSDDNQALRDGVQQMTTQVGEFTQAVNAMTGQVGEVRDGVGELIAVLQDSAKQGNAGPTLNGGSIGLGSGDAGQLEGGEVNFEAGGNVLPNGAEQRRLVTHQNEDFAYGDWFVSSPDAPSVIPKLTPYLPGDTTGSYIQAQILETLAALDYDEPGLWRPSLAESWNVSADGLTIVFKLREDVRFSGGELMTAEDVIFTYNWVMNPDIAAPRIRSYWERIESVQATGKYEVTFKLKDSYFLGFSICAGLQVLSKEYYSQFTPDEYNAMPGLLYGSGPYKLQGDPKDWKPDTSATVLVRNENYWSVKPALDRLVFKIFTSRQPMVTAFRNGEFDNLKVFPDEYLNFRDDDELRKDRRWMEYSNVNGGYRYIGWNTLRPIFADRRVRQALTMLVNREQITERLLNGTATIANGPFHPLGDQDDPQITPWPYDPTRAMALLEEAGWRDRGSGILENENGESFRFEITFPATVPIYKSMAEVIQQSMAAAKIDVKLNPQEWNSMLESLDARDFDASILGWGAGGPESDVYQMFHSDNIADGGDNYVSFQNDELDAAISAARFELDNEKRFALWRKVHAILYEEQPYTFLSNPRNIRMVDERLKNAEATTLYDFINWDEFYVPGSQQVPRQ